MSDHTENLNCTLNKN